MLMLNYFHLSERTHRFLIQIVLLCRKQISVSAGFVAIKLRILTFSQLISSGFLPLQHLFNHYFLSKGSKPHCTCGVSC